MGTSTDTTWHKPDLDCILDDPAKYAQWYADMDVVITERKLEETLQRAENLKAELARKKDRQEQLRTGTIPPIPCDASLERIAGHLHEEYCGENIKELNENDREAVRVLLALSQLQMRGWMVDEAKVSDWHEEIRIARSRSKPRHRNNKKKVFAALKAAVTEQLAEKNAATTPVERKAAALATYKEHLGDLGVVGRGSDVTVEDTVRAYWKAHCTASEEGLLFAETGEDGQRLAKITLAATLVNFATGISAGSRVGQYRRLAAPP